MRCDARKVLKNCIDCCLLSGCLEHPFAKCKPGVIFECSEQTMDCLMLNHLDDLQHLLEFQSVLKF